MPIINCLQDEQKVTKNIIHEESKLEVSKPESCPFFMNDDEKKNIIVLE